MDEGAIFCLEDRSVLGRVEEVFGPVLSPLYALRYGGPGDMPASVAPGAHVFAVERLIEYVLPELVNSKVRFQGLVRVLARCGV